MMMAPALAGAIIESKFGATGFGPLSCHGVEARRERRREYGTGNVATRGVGMDLETLA